MKSLTPRELEIAHLVAGGLSNKGIARILDIEEGTIKQHLHNVFQKLEISSRVVLATMITNLLHTSAHGDNTQ
jgi:two-component system, NarL family, nitrate/nitrite response regulator NarL